MAQTSYPLPGGGRIITDAEYERLVGQLVPSGWIGTVGDSAIVYGDSSGMLVRVRANRQVHVRGFMWESGSSEFTKSIDTNTSGATRVDLVVVRLTRSTWAVTIEVRKGTPGAGAPAPVRDQTGGVYEVPIATVTVANNASTISASAVYSVAWMLAAGSIIRCLSTYRPPHVMGLPIYETNTGRFWISTGSIWALVYEDTGWENLTVLSGWTKSPTGGARVRKVGAQCTLEIDLFRSGATMKAGGSNTAMAQLPAGFAPSGRGLIGIGSVNHVGGTVRFSVSTSGRVDIAFYTLIEKGDAVSIVVSWPVG